MESEPMLTPGEKSPCTEIRTRNPMIMSPVLYQPSYSGPLPTFQMLSSNLCGLASLTLCEVLGVRIINVLVLLMVVITFILCLVRGSEVSAYYLLACNTVISAFVGIVVNWWYKSGDLGSEKYWYILVVAGVLLFQSITTDVFIFNAVEESPAGPTTQVFSWHTFRPTANSSRLKLTTPLPLH